MEKQEKLEQKSAELEVWEVKLRDWEEKLKSWEERLQNHENRLKELEKRLGINKEEVVANPVDSQDSSQATPQTPTETEEPKGDGKEKIKRAGRRTKKAIQDLAEKIQSTPKGSPPKDSQEPTIRKIRRTPVDWIEFREIMEKPQGELFPDLPEELGHNCAGNDCEECKKRRIMVA